MANFKLIFKSPWPMAGEIRKPGEVLLEGTSPITGIRPDKILNAIINGAVEIKEENSGKKKSRQRLSGDDAPGTKGLGPAPSAAE